MERNSKYKQKGGERERGGGGVLLKTKTLSGRECLGRWNFPPQLSAQDWRI